MTTFMAMDILGCALHWINLNVEYIKEHQKTLEHLIEKFEIEKDIDDTDAKSIIRDYVLSLTLFTKATENLNERVNGYLKGRGAWMADEVRKLPENKGVTNDRK